MMGKFKVLTGGCRPDVGLLWRNHRATRPGSNEACREKAKKPLITQRPADLLKPEWQELAESALALPGCHSCDEDVLTYAMSPQVAPNFFLHRKEGPKNVGSDPAKNESGQAAPLRGPVKYAVTYAGKTHNVTVAPL